MPLSRYSALKPFAYPGKLRALRSGRLSAPVHIRLKPTNVCNHACSFCAYRSDALKLGEDMTEREGISHASNYTYDAWYRVNEAKQQTDGEEETLTYNFDELDRLTGVSSDRASSAAHVGDMAYDAERPLALQTAGATELEHDAAGQMTRRGDLELEWDYMARITKALKYGKEERHIYGADKARIAIIGEDRTVFYGFGNAEIRDGVSHVYVRPLSDRLARSNATTLMTEIFEDMDEDGTLTSVDAWLAQEEGADRVLEKGALAQETRGIAHHPRGE